MFQNFGIILQRQISKGMATEHTNHATGKKEPLYRSLVSPQVMDALQERITRVILVEKKYRDKEFSAQKLASELGTNTRYISAVINVRFRMNYASFVNKYRIEDAMTILADKRYKSLTMEDVADMVGFANRQSFYSAFRKVNKCTPRDYKIKAMEERMETEKRLAEKKKASKKKTSTMQ